MPRIRSIKPEFFTSEQVADCSPTARLLFIGLWCFCDDGGVHPLSAKRIKMEVFPADDFSTDQILGWLQELLVAGLLRSYLVSDQRFVCVTGWKHQKIESPTYRHPQPSSGVKFDDYSSIALREIDDSSPLESRGGESKGVEGKGEDDCNEAATRPSLPTELAYPDFGCTKGRRSGSITWTLTTEFISELQQTFEGIDVAAECRKAWQWHKTNWAKRKTADGMPEFLRRWLTRAQNSGRGTPRVIAPASRLPTPEDDANWTPHGSGGGV